MNILSRFPLLILLFALSLFSGAHVATAATVNGNNVTTITTKFNETGDVFSKVESSRWVLKNSDGEIMQRYKLKTRSYRWVRLKHITDDVTLRFDMVHGYIYMYTDHGDTRVTLVSVIDEVFSW